MTAKTQTPKRPSRAKKPVLQPIPTTDENIPSQPETGDLLFRITALENAIREQNSIISGQNEVIRAYRVVLKDLHNA
jgi:hypothetical protein